MGAYRKGFALERLLKLDEARAAYTQAQQLDSKLADAKSVLNAAASASAIPPPHTAIGHCSHCDALGHDPVVQGLESVQKLMGEMKLTETEIAATTPKENPQKERFETLVKWCLDGGCRFPQLFIKYYDKEYRGVHANTTIPDDTIILEVSCLSLSPSARLSLYLSVWPAALI